MDTKKMFDAFISKNDLKLKPDFKRKKVLYCGLSSNPMTEEEIKGTIEYVAFVDGVTGKPRRFEGPKGAHRPKKQRILELEEILGDLADQFEDAGVDREAQLLRDAASESAEKNPLKRYNEQYDLGTALCGNI